MRPAWVLQHAEHAAAAAAAAGYLWDAVRLDYPLGPFSLCKSHVHESFRNGEFFTRIQLEGGKSNQSMGRYYSIEL